MITSSGDFCKYSVHIKAGLNCIPPSDDYSVSKKLAGKHLFCGMLQNSHFGHFMVESVSRLWASGFLKDIDSLVFYKRKKRSYFSMVQHITSLQWLRKLLKMFSLSGGERSTLILIFN